MKKIIFIITAFTVVSFGIYTGAMALMPPNYSKEIEAQLTKESDAHSAAMNLSCEYIGTLMAQRNRAQLGIEEQNFRDRFGDDAYNACSGTPPTASESSSLPPSTFFGDESEVK